MYYRGAQAAIVVYDITSAESFEKAKSWITELQQQGSPNIVIAIAGNKADLAAQRTVQTDVKIKKIKQKSKPKKFHLYIYFFVCLFIGCPKVR